MNTMRLVYPLFAFLFSIVTVQAQTLEYQPVQGNAIIKGQSVLEELHKLMLSKDQSLHDSNLRNTDPCPPEYLGYLVASGDSISFTIDTLGLGRGDSAFLTLSATKPLLYGKATIKGFRLTYHANAGLSGAVKELVSIVYEEKGRKVTIEVNIQVTRKGRSVVAKSRIVEPESVSTYCLSTELNFTSKKACSRFLSSANSYDGKGRQSYHFTSYTFADTCLVYYASRFPGNDTLNIRICDVLSVCDTFKIPFIVRGDTLKNLPFFDDFSAYRGPWPSAKFWLDKNVYVNNSLAPNPPSVGFATFDGLDRKGNPYNLISGPGDFLTSKSIDLSKYNTTSDVSLKYYLAPKGYGQAPEVGDSIMVEFRNNQGKWIRMATVKGLGDVALDSFPPFVFRSIKISEAQFLHKAFQFRFTAFTSPGGAVDLWHLDYVRLAANEGLSNTFPDVAFTSTPASILKNYTSMPWWQFKGHEDKELQDKLKSNFFNHFDFQTALGASSVSFRETSTGTNFNQNFTVVETGQDNNMPIKSHALRNRTIPAGNFTGIKQNLMNIPSGDFRNLETKYSFTVTAQAAEYQVNDTVSLNTPFSNYFAHDDGTAEWQVFVKFAKGGEQMASRFHLNAGDTLRAVQIMFPHVVGDVQDQIFKLKIWIGDPATAKPIFERDLLRPFYANNVIDTMQGFTTYRLEDFIGKQTPVYIPAGQFWVGWQQQTAASLGIPVGFDLHNPCDCNFSNITGLWKAFPSSLKGSLMIRPVFGKTAPPNTVNQASQVIQDASTIVSIYPNPSSGTLNFDLKEGFYSDYQLTLSNAVGQIVFKSALSATLLVNELHDGMYFMRLENKKTGALFNQKILIAANKRP